MKMKECKIVQDILPNYIEQLTSEETNQYVEEHLNSCEECKNIYENMKSEMNLNENKINNREVKYIKKFNNKMKILKLIIFIILLCVFIHIGKNMYIVTSLSRVAEKNTTNTNFHLVEYICDKGVYTKTEVYNMNNKRKVIKTTFDLDNSLHVEKMYGIKNDDNDLYSINLYTECNEGNTLKRNYKDSLDFKVQNTLDTNNLWELFKAIIPATIRTASVDYQDCYYIANYHTDNSFKMGGYYGMYVNKENGLMISSLPFEEKQKINENAITVCPFIYREYEFDTVTEQDFIEPDMTQYKLIENN